MHADHFRKNLYGLVTALRDGGYSDDMTLAAIAGIIHYSFLNPLPFVGFWKTKLRNTIS
jgi:hypothetical protein